MTTSGKSAVGKAPSPELPNHPKSQNRNPQSRHGLLRRLLFLYGGMALLPSILAGGFLVLYLRGQIAKLGESSRQQTLRWLNDHNRQLEQASNKTVANALRSIRTEQHQLLEQSSTKLTHLQLTTLRKTFDNLGKRLDLKTQIMQSATEGKIRRAYSQLENSLLDLHAHSYKELTEEIEVATRRAVEQLVIQSTEQATRNVGTQIENFIRQATSMLSLVSQQPALRQNPSQESFWVLDSLQNRDPAYRLLVLLDHTGEPTQIVGDEEPLRGVAQPFYKACLEAILEGEVYVGQEILFLNTGGIRYPLLPLAVPIKVRGNQVKGAVFTLLSIERLATLVQGLRFGQTGYSFLCTESGVVLAHRDPERLGTRVERLVAHVQEFFQAGKRSSEIPAEGGERSLVTAVSIPNQRWLLITVQPTKEAYALAEQLHSKFRQSTENANRSMRSTLKQTALQSSQGILSEVKRYRNQFRQQAAGSGSQAAERMRRDTRNLTTQQIKATALLLQRQTADTENLLCNQMSQQYVLWSSRLENAFTPLIESTLHDLDRQVLNALALMLALTTALGLFGGVFVTRTLVLPMHHLMRATQAIAQGDLSRRVQVRTRDELGELAESFNRMVDALEKSQCELGQTQAQLVQSAKLASLGTLASGVAHELNQPLAIIRAIAQQNLSAMEKDNTTSPPHPLTTLREDLQRVQYQTSRMMRIIQHLRTFARKSGEGFEEVNVNEVLQNLLILLREQLHNRGIQLQEQYASDLPLVMGDANALEQVFINLLTNARDALERQPDATLTLTTRTHTEGCQHWVEVCVADNGPGIPPEIQSQIFDPFFTTKEPGQGTGLGLSISFEIIQKHHGTLHVESQVGAGATFYVRLPALAASHQERQLN